MLHHRKDRCILIGNIVKIALLTLLWVVLREEITAFNIVSGLLIGVGAITYSRKFLPLSKIKNVNFIRLIPYVFYLLGQVYLSGFYVIKIILQGKARAEIVQVKTLITNPTLRVILADSITLTPGSILLDLSEDKITVVLLMSKDEPQITDNADGLVKGRLEEKLLSAEMSAK